MRKTTILVFSGLALALALQSVFACNYATGEREQNVVLSWSGQLIEMWKPDPDTIRRVNLPNGFNLGIQIEPASAEKYTQLSKTSRYVPEMVEITLYDMSTEPGKRLTHTWGGANSIQGYGADGGADRVDALGSPGIELVLLKPVCAVVATP